MGTDPAETALTDQAQAAQRNAREALHRSAEKHGATVEHGPANDGAARILQRLRSAVDDRTIGTCPHIDPRQPQRLFWIAWAPEAMSCGECARGLVSNQQQSCDLCGGPDGRVVVLQLPAQVDGPRLFAIGPTTVMTQLCVGCQG